MTITPCANIHCPACSLFPEQLNGSGRALWTQAPRIPQNFIFRSQLLTGDQFLHCGPHLLIPTQILHIFPPVPIRFRYSPDCVFSSQGNTNVDIWTSDVNLYGFVNLLSHYVSDEHERETKTMRLIQIWKKKMGRCCSFWFPFFDTLYISHICLCCCILLKGACILVILIQKMKSSEMCKWKVLINHCKFQEFPIKRKKLP